jgi:hypothetical protein
MNLVHPWALFAGIAVGLPLLIHWLTRPRPVRLPLSTLRFVRDAVRQRRAFHRLRDVLLLLLRAAAVALIALAFARPLIGAKPSVSAEPPGGAARVVILDQSQGMGEIFGGATAFERARAAAAKYLTYSPSARCNLILAGGKPRPVVERLTGNFAALREELSTAQPLPQRIDVMAAINLAADQLSAGPAGRRRELIVVSNFQRSNWSGVDFSVLPQDTHIQLESVAPSTPPANLAVLKVAPQGRVEQGRETRIDVEVGNYSPAARDVQVALSAASFGTTLKGVCPPNGKVTLAATLIPPRAGWIGGTATLIGVDDALPTDNSRPFVLNVRPAPSYALVTREPPTPQPTSSHFLERALAPFQARGESAASAEHVTRIASDALDRESVANADLVVLDHPGKLSQAQMGVLSSLLRRGRPVLYVAAEPVDATNLKLLEELAGSDLKMPVDFAPPLAGALRHDLFLTNYRGAAAPFSTFGDSLPAAVGPLRFGGGLASHPLAGGLEDDVLAEYADHSACLVLTPCGAGMLAVLNTDLNQSNLTASPIFVPLLGELVDRMLSRQSRKETESCGEALVAYLPPEAGAAMGLRVVGPDASADAHGTISDDANSALWRWNAAGRPGVYSVMRDDATVFALAAAAPALTSDLQTLEPQVFEDRLSGGRDVTLHAADDTEERHDNLWAWILVACCGCMLSELLVLRGFRT